MTMFSRGCLLPHTGRTDVQWSQLRFSGSEARVAGYSRRSFPVWWRLANCSSNCTVMVLIRNTACDVAVGSQVSFMLPCWKVGDTLTLPWFLHLLYDEHKESLGSCGEPMYQMHLSRHTSTLLWPNFHTNRPGMKLYMYNTAISWYLALCLTWPWSHQKCQKHPSEKRNYISDVPKTKWATIMIKVHKQNPYAAHHLPWSLVPPANTQKGPRARIATGARHAVSQPLWRHLLSGKHSNNADCNTHHMYKFHANRFSQQSARVVKSGNKLVQTRPFYFLTLDVGQGVIEVEHNTALLQLPYHKTWLVTSRRVWKHQQTEILKNSTRRTRIRTPQSIQWSADATRCH